MVKVTIGMYCYLSKPLSKASRKVLNEIPWMYVRPHSPWEDPYLLHDVVGVKLNITLWQWLKLLVSFRRGL
jgi:hypothetical protein